MNYQRLNNIVGWLVGFFATLVYILTAESSAGFWDCGEFLAAAYKLEIGHPPGAPTFMLVGRLFSLFAPSVEQVAYLVNCMSAVCSGLTVLFLFWTITHFAKRLVKLSEEDTTAKRIAVLAAGVVGGMSYCFSDTAWFSAVEAEVYAFSSLLTAIVFWAILKWEEEYGNPYAARWIVLIFFLIGLSIGVHLLNLLTIPAVVFVVYYKIFKPSRKGAFMALGIGVAVLAAILFIIVPGLVRVSFWVDYIFVNGLGMPFNSGAAVLFLVVFAFVSYGIYRSHQRGQKLLNLSLLSLFMVLIGYSTFAIVLIRSQACPPLNENDPSNSYSLLAYLNREQYGSSPLLYGHYYNAPYTVEDGETIYVDKGGKYGTITLQNGKTDTKQNVSYDSRFTTFFPRMWSNRDNHAKNYQRWGEIKGRKIKVKGRDGQPQTLVRPTFSENLRFFFYYQLNYMYIRYFMWNFAGRQNDLQGFGGILRGNWITGIDWLDSIRLGNQSKITTAMKNTSGRNVYFALPLLLGILGMLYAYRQKQRGKQTFWVVFLLFMFTGPAIVLFLNQYAYQPRERDYAYAASFYAFSIYLGFGVLFLINAVGRYLQNKQVAAWVASCVSFLAVPTLMGAQNWDDHNRSGSRLARDMAANYLNSCTKNGYIFTAGDNDTFPLWYAQEVEGVRTDLRILNLSYLQAAWYIEQMRKKCYASAPVPFTLDSSKVEGSKRSYIEVYPRVDKPIEAKKMVRYVGSDTKQTKITHGGNVYTIFPSKTAFLVVNKEAALRNGVVAEKDSKLIEDTMIWNISSMTKERLMQFDLIAHTDWSRGIFFAHTIGSRYFQNLENYFQDEGLAYQLVPIRSANKLQRVNTDSAYYRMMNLFRFGGLEEDNSLYLNETSKGMVINLLSSMWRLSNALVDEGKKEQATEVIEKAYQIFPQEDFSIDDGNSPTFSRIHLMLADVALKVGMEELATKKLRECLTLYQENLIFCSSVSSKLAKNSDIQGLVRTSAGLIYHIADIAKRHKMDGLAEEATQMLKGAENMLR